MASAPMPSRSAIVSAAHRSALRRCSGRRRTSASRHARAQARGRGLPAIAALRDGGFLFLGKVGDDKALVQAFGAPRPSLMTRQEFEAVWDGRLILMTRRAGLLD